MGITFKETKIGWIPEDWTTKPLSKLVGSDRLDFIDGDWIESPYITSEGIRLIQTGNIGIGSFLDTTQRYVSEQTFVELKCKEVYPGDMLICRLAAPIGRACIVPDTGEKYITAVDCTIVRPDSAIADKYYLNHFINWRRTISLMGRYGAGVTHQRISRKNLGKIPIPLPTLPEQRKIAEILSTVDETIEKTDAIIQETRQLKKGLMQKLFTEGIGHTKFKETKIGRIPEEWEVGTIKDIGDVKGGKRLPKGQRFAETQTAYPYIRVIDFQNMSVYVEQLEYLTEEVQRTISRYTISSNDVYISIAGTIGLVGTVPHELDGANITENAAKICNLKKVDKSFLACYLSSFQAQKQISSFTGISTQPKLALNRIEKIRLPMLGSDEQRKIAGILSEVDSKIEKERAFKEELEQLKKGLMQVLLTGKVRVEV